MSFKFGTTSLSRMENVHPDLIRVMALALQRSPIDFTVLEGRRTEARQRELVKQGASKTMNSRHLHGLALDIAPVVDGKVTWDWKFYHQLAPVIKAAAKELGVPLTWGGDWTTFPDGPHWELPHALYPDRMTFTKPDVKGLVSAAGSSGPAAPAPVGPPVVQQPATPQSPTVVKHHFSAGSFILSLDAGGNLTIQET